MTSMERAMRPVWTPMIVRDRESAVCEASGVEGVAVVESSDLERVR